MLGDFQQEPLMKPIYFIFFKLDLEKLIAGKLESLKFAYSSCTILSSNQNYCHLRC